MEIKEIIEAGERAEGRWFALPPVERKLIIFATTLLTVISLGSYFWFYYLPQKEADALATRLSSLLAETKTNLDGVHSEISGLFELVSGEKVPPAQTARLNLGEMSEELAKRVAGAQTVSGFYEFLLAARRDLANGSSRVVELESGSASEARTIREKAILGRIAATRARDSFLLLLDELPSIFPSLDTIVPLTDLYLSEAQKTANFYAAVSEVQVDLIPTTVSLVTLIQEVSFSSAPSVYLGKIRQLSGTIQVLEAKLAALGDTLPSGMETLHQDNLFVFSLLGTLLSEAEAAAQANDSARLGVAVAEFEVELEVLATRAKTYELNFWQKTIVLKGYPEISAGYQTALDELGIFVQ